MEKNVKTSEEALMKLKKQANVKKIVGIILVAWNTFAIFANLVPTITGDLSVNSYVIWVVLCALFLGLGVILILNAKKLNAIINCFGVYSTMLRGSYEAQTVNYSEITKITGQDLATTMKDVDTLIKYNLWEGVYGGVQYVQDSMKRKLNSHVEVKCDNCGNVTTVHLNSADTRCAYCRNPLTQEIQKALHK